MKILIFFPFLIFGSIVYLRAQPPTVPNPAETRQITKQQESDRRFEAVRSESEFNGNVNNSSRGAALYKINNFYRKPNKTESKRLAPEKEDAKTYRQFLQSPDTGLTKLIVDKGCDEFISVLNVSEDCMKYSMPGAGASFSFRTGNYCIGRLSDLTYKEDGFYSSGILSHAILVNIGDVALEQVSLQTGGLKFLTDFETVSDYEKAKETDMRIVNGIEDGGFFYTRNTAAAENKTYLLRSIAYRGNYYRALQGFVYDELDFDERRDVTVAFRVIRRDAESATILWKILSNQKSPVIKKTDRDQSKTKEIYGRN